ncbi:hypothetical protein [Leucobacter luti]|uniref:hypothetical protein n=1 Tax=Leucobacter luti TaxID=340320 RepID=UPI00105EB9C0|nr:hypothetical protein [Leucobacter luti]
MPASQQLLSEAIDRCSAKIVHAERAQFSGLWMTIGMVLATTGLIVMAVASTHYDGGELSWRTSEFWWPFGGWLAMVVGMGLTVMASKVTARSSVGFESLRETELHEIDERYAHRQRYRRSRSKQNLESQRHKQRVLNKKRAKAIKGLRRNRPAGNSR